MAIIGTLSYEFSIILPLIAQNTFSGNAGSYASLVSATGLGAVVGGLFAAGRKKVFPKMFVFSALGFGISLTIAALMPTIFLMMVIMFFAGIFSINFISLGNVTLQTESKPEMRGRVMALWTMAFVGSTPIGGPIIGWIGEHIGPRYGLAVGGVAAIVASGIGMITILGKTKVQTISKQEDILEKQTEQAEAVKR